MSARIRSVLGGAAIAVAISLTLVHVESGPSAATRGSASLREVRGEVVTVTRVRAEGGLDVVAVDVDAGDGGHARRILLAPASVLSDAGFEVAEGDVLRARVFVNDDGDVEAAQRVLNVSRRGMIRLRTFHRDPLWDTHGRWQGAGPSATGAGRVRERSGGTDPRR